MLKKIDEIKEMFYKANINQLPELIDYYHNDQRVGVKLLCKQYNNKVKKHKEELLRFKNMKDFEEKYKNYEYICGIDEAGRGPLAGPLVAAAVILPKDCDIIHINDSKKLSANKREELYDEIISKALAFSVAIIPSKRIDEINILQATHEAMKDAVDKLEIKPDILLVDALKIKNIDIEQVSIVKGDQQSLSIAAASILAKVTRDRIMMAYDKVFPGYNFFSNKGYGSKEHENAIQKLGPCNIHRRTFITKFI